jgi:hypothetical protein
MQVIMIVQFFGADKVELLAAPVLVCETGFFGWLQVVVFCLGERVVFVEGDGAVAVEPVCLGDGRDAVFQLGPVCGGDGGTFEGYLSGRGVCLRRRIRLVESCWRHIVLGEGSLCVCVGWFRGRRRVRGLWRKGGEGSREADGLS